MTERSDSPRYLIVNIHYSLLAMGEMEEAH